MPVDPTEEAVQEAYQASFDAWTACVAALPNCDVESLAPFLTGDYLALSTEQAALWNELGQTATGTETRRLAIESVDVDPAGADATVISCEVDASIRYSSSGEIVNDDYESVRRASVMRLVEGTWRIAAIENLESGTTPEGDVCADA
jgi:hypothetical protein